MKTKIFWFLWLGLVSLLFPNCALKYAFLPTESPNKALFTKTAENRTKEPEYAETRNELRTLLQTEVKFRFVRVAHDMGRDMGEGWFDPFWGLRNNKMVSTEVVPVGALKDFCKNHTRDEVLLAAKELIPEFKRQCAPFNHSPHLCFMIAQDEHFLDGESVYIRPDGTSDYDWQTIKSMAWSRSQKKN